MNHARLTFVVSSLWLSGGVHAVTEYANRLAARGHEVAIVVPRGAIDESVARRLGPMVRTIEAGLGAAPHMGLAARVRLSVALAKAIPPGTVAIATHTPTTVAALLSAVMSRGPRPFWFYQDYWEMFAGRPVEQLLLALLPRSFRDVLVVSGASALEMKRFGARHVTVVRQGLSDEAYFYPPADTAQRETGLILYLGDMRPRKGWLDFFAAVEQLYRQDPSLHLAIVSKDLCQIDARVPYRYYYRPARPDLAELFRRCSVFVSASWWESFGLPPLEAMACGAPVVLTDSRGTSEYARPEENCLVVPPHQPQRLADAIGRVMCDSSLARRLSEVGPPTAREYDWEACVDRFEAAVLGTS